MQSEVAVVEPREFLVVEGLFVLCYPEVAQLANVKAYIDASPEVRLERRKHRDMTVCAGTRPRRSSTNGSTTFVPRTWPTSNRAAPPATW